MMATPLEEAEIICQARERQNVRDAPSSSSYMQDPLLQRWTAGFVFSGKSNSLPKWRRKELLSKVMNKIDRIGERKPALLDVVALLAGVQAEKLARGTVGTVVELLDAETAMVEFSDDEGRAHAITPVKFKDLLVLHYLPEAA